MALQSPSQPYQWTFRRVMGATLVLVFIALGFWLLYRFSQVVFILFIAIVMGTVIRPVVTWLYRRGLPRIAGVILVYLILFALLIIFVLLLFPLIVEQGTTIAAAVPGYYQSLRWMIEKYFSAEIPDPKAPSTGLGKDLEEKAGHLSSELARSIPDLDFNTALTKTWEVIGIANKYIEESKPWTLSKEGKTDELARVMYNLAEALRIVSIAVYLFMPVTALNIHKQLGLGDGPKSMTISSIKTWGGIKPGTKVSKDKPLFPRIEVK